MGSGESTARKVTFGVDEEDRVRVVRGVKLSEDVLQRMKGMANMPPQRLPSPPAPPTPQKVPASSSMPELSSKPQSQPSSKPQPQSSPSPRTQPRSTPQSQPSSKPQTQSSPKPQTQPSPKPQTQSSPKPESQSSSKPQTQSSPKPESQSSTRSNTSKTTSPAKEKVWRSEREQAILREELAKAAQREREAAREEVSRALKKERLQKNQQTEETRRMVHQLQQKDAELKVLESFYKEQLLDLEKKNMERFKQSTEHFHSSATKSEANVRPRSTEAVCSGLQTQIMWCYRDNRDQALRCSDLAKEYMQCIDAAKKNLLVNHG